MTWTTAVTLASCCHGDRAQGCAPQHSSATSSPCTTTWCTAWINTWARRPGGGAQALFFQLVGFFCPGLEGFDFSLLSSCSYRVSPVDLTDLHVIRYELERDLMPLILSNTQYSIERGQESLQEYNFVKIQQQLVSRFLLGKPLITLQVSGGTKSSSFTWLA